MNDLPPAHRRRVIVPLTDSERRLCRSEQASRKMLTDDEVLLIDLPLNPDVASAVSGLVLPGPLQSGSVLVQSALNGDVYYTADDAPERLAHDKWLQTVAYCQLLGATTVVIGEVEKGNRSETTSVKGRVSRGKLGHLDVSYRDDAAEAFKREAVLEHRFQGGPPKLDAARTHLQTTGLASDAHLAALVDLRADSNRLEEQHLRLSTSREAKREREWLQKVRLPIGAQQLRVESAIEELREYEITFSVAFG